MTKQETTSTNNVLSAEDNADFKKQTRFVPLLKSTKFNRTNITVTIPIQTGTFNNQKDTSSILKLKKDGGMFDRIDHDISGWEFDNNPTYKGCEVVTGVIDKFINDIKHGDIINESKMLGRYRNYNIWEAELLANELVKSGAINQKGKGVIIYLTETKDGIPCKLDVWCDCSDNIEVYVGKVRTNNECTTNYGVLSK